MSIQKIVITGDIFRVNRVGEPSQNINIIWLYEALRNPLRLATNLPVEKQVFNDYPNTLSQIMYEYFDEKMTLQGWARLYSAQSLSHEILQHIWLNFRHAIVIAFELPKIIKFALENLGIAYIDIIIHPARFLDDIIFGVCSNCSKIFSIIQNYKIPEEIFLMSSGLVMASMSRLKRLDFIQGKSALFCGQVSDDKTLIKDGNFMKIEYLKNEIVKLSEEYETFLFKPHPCEDNNQNTNNEYFFTSCVTNSVAIDENFYYLLSHENLKSVYSMNSSTSVEARYFGKSGLHLIDYPFQFIDNSLRHDMLNGDSSFDSVNSLFVSVDDVIFSADFWRDILSPVVPVTKKSHIRLPKKPNRIRTSLRNYWGFNFVDTDIIGELYEQSFKSY